MTGASFANNWISGATLNLATNRTVTVAPHGSLALTVGASAAAAATASMLAYQPATSRAAGEHAWAVHAWAVSDK